ncbi:enamine deaminase RidA (YjgF/YER057c/UK114 family) [Bradyrhizobium sp. cir1]|nr:RidA family protein [Bradyrhizobium sp. cir1]MBB4369189.1 enamine deaminase RidA (YjgF/YER057c/UK114 family) [Bradyrhizobium sp. cir1]
MIKLPAPPKPRGNDRPTVTFGGLVQLGGQVSRDDAGMAITRRLVSGDDLATARQAAETAMLRCLSALEAEIGSLDRAAQILMVRGYIRSMPDFEAHPQVMDAASDILVSVLDERTRSLAVSARDSAASISAALWFIRLSPSSSTASALPSLMSK